VISKLNLLIVLIQTLFNLDVSNIVKIADLYPKGGFIVEKVGWMLINDFGRGFAGASKWYIPSSINCS